MERSKLRELEKRVGEILGVDLDNPRSRKGEAKDAREIISLIQGEVREALEKLIEVEEVGTEFFRAQLPEMAEHGKTAEESKSFLLEELSRVGEPVKGGGSSSAPDKLIRIRQALELSKDTGVFAQEVQHILDEPDSWYCPECDINVPNSISDHPHKPPKKKKSTPSRKPRVGGKGE